MLGQSRTEEILRDRLAEFGVRVELDTAIVGFTQNDDAVTAELSTGETVEARSTWSAPTAAGASSASTSGSRSRAPRTSRSGCCWGTSRPTGSTTSTATGSPAGQPDGGDRDDAAGRWGPVPVRRAARTTIGRSVAGDPAATASIGTPVRAWRSCGTSPGRPCGGRTSAWPSGSGSGGCSSRAMPRTSTRRPVGRASTPASRTRTTSDGSWRTDVKRCSRRTRPSAAPMRRACSGSART